MPSSQIDYVAFGPVHLDGALRLSQAAGWPHRREDCDFVLQLSEGFVALKAGQVVGTTMLTRYGADAAAINMVIVDAALRGRGIGRRLMGLALDAAVDRTCRLIATQDGLRLYESLGFVAQGEIEQHQGPLVPMQAGDGVSWSDPHLAAAAAELDHAASGLDRGSLIAMLFAQGRVATLCHGGALAGFAVVRPFGRGMVAGPVVAASAETAQALLAFVFAAHPGAFMRVDTPAVRGLGPFLAACGLACVNTAIAMRRGSQPVRPPGPATFALASQALG